jgi:hypothetical protein
MSLQIGRIYTRQEISDLLGGSIQAYLPVANGRVVCGCFFRSEAMNPNAPEEVLFGTSGDSRDINKSADLVFQQGQQGEAVPVFLKIDSGEWEYHGDYLCIGITRDSRIINRKMAEWPKRGRFHGVLRFERV